MERVIVSYTKSVQIYFDELIIALFNEKYFLYEENAIEYVEKLVFYISNTIQTFPYKKSPESLSKFGDFYIFYKSNSRTTWYIFFSKKETNYLIKHITNNHSFDSNLLNEN